MDVHWPSVLSFSPTQVAYTWCVWTEYQKSCIKIATCRRNQSSFSHWFPHQNTTWASLPRHSTRQRGEYKYRWGPWLRPINCGSQMEGIPMSPWKPGCFEDFWGISYWRLLNSNPIRFLGGVIFLGLHHWIMLETATPPWNFLYSMSWNSVPQNRAGDW